MISSVIGSPRVRVDLATQPYRGFADDHREAARPLQRNGKRAVGRLRYPGVTPPLGTRPLYIIAFGLFGPESVFASEAEKAGQILRARLQPGAQLLVRFNNKRGGGATSASLAAAFAVPARPWTRPRTF